MNLELHYLILFAIAGLALIVWILGLLYLLATTRRTAASESWEEDDEIVDTAGHVTVRGSAEVEGTPAALAAKAAGHLAQHGAATLGPVKILDQTDDHVVFEAMPHLGGRFVRRGVLHFHGQPSGRTQIDYAILIPNRNGLLVAAWIVQVLGLLVLLIGFPVMLLWVAPNPNPAIHWQSVQMLHVMHFLWPPFLFGAIYRRVQTHVRNTFDSLVHNLPYLQG